MAPGDEWDAEKMLQVYILDYMKKKNMHTAADVFATEANVGSNPIAIESAGGFLAEWWSIFYDVFASRQALGEQGTSQQEARGDGSSLEIQTTENELQSLHPLVPNFEMNQQTPGLFTNLENMLGQQSSSLSAAKMHRQQQIARQTQQRVRRDNRQGINMGRATSMDPNLYGVPRAAIPRAGPLDSEMNEGVNPMPLKGQMSSGLTPMLQLPIQKPQFQLPRAQYQQDPSIQILPHTTVMLGVDQLPSGLGIQGLNPMFQLPKLQSQFQLPRAQHQQGPSIQGADQIPSSLSHQGLKSMLQPPKLQPQFQALRAQHRQESSTQLLSHTPTTLGVDQVPSGLGNQVLNSLQSPKHQSQFQVPRAQHQQEPSTQLLSNTPAILGVDQIPSSLGNQGLNPTQGPNPQQQYSMSIALEPNPQQQFKTMIQMGDTAEQQQHDQAQKQQSEESGRKRKSLSNSGSGDNILACNTAEKEKPIDENVESYLSPDDVNANTVPIPFSILKRDSSDCTTNEDTGFTFKEVGRLQASKGKVLCCHFSSDGKMLVSSGHDKKVMIWSMETYDYVCTTEEHSLLITDVRFKPNSALFATSSFDRSVQIWDADKPSNALVKLHGHAEQVTSVDFHPRKLDLLCSCDSNNEIRLWNVSQQVCTHTTKGATKQVRFQPRVGKLLATAVGNGINIIDVETDTLQAHLKGHTKDVRAICWDTSGKYVASISEDSARVWSPTLSGKCIHELLSNGNNFQSCTFHPGYSQLLAIGGYQTLELWNPTESNKTISVPAHMGLIAALADSPQAEVIASASHDQCVKLWK
ncbi:transcriptional corepressor LEUNIG_HOMOLOG isoform X4 [Vitis vinifera]|uniref:transcriptional corepressor LEUNIG_HOMOLOG isoform X4 n=1 Tax=Vitis vinifera TaxID=29760 RepID=UPI002882F452|nr:transcriptional corepressor LEUNIG_HOMOLOG isoform X4 [Vitis vinifera]